MPSLSTTSLQPLSADAFDALDDILDDLRTRYDQTPQWEFCEGFLAALVCCRGAIALPECLEVLLAIDGTHPPAAPGEQGSFANAQQQAQFTSLWQQRMAQVAHALDADVEVLDDPAAYQPQVLDVRALWAGLPADEQAAVALAQLPAFAQVWALGFMYVVESWPAYWTTPEQPSVARRFDAALQAVVALTEDDTDVPEVSPGSDDGVASISVARLQAFADAIWALYDLRALKLVA